MFRKSRAFLVASPERATPTSASLFFARDLATYPALLQGAALQRLNALGLGRALVDSEGGDSPMAGSQRPCCLVKEAYLWYLEAGSSLKLLDAL